MFTLSSVKDLEYELLQGSDSIELTDVCDNSKDIVKGSVFVCIKGANFDSHSVAGAVAKSGAAALVIESDIELPKDITVIKVKNTRRALALISAACFDYPTKKLTCIGVTGTKGKTTTTHMIKRILEEAGCKVGMIGTNGIYIGDKRLPSVNTTPESYDIQKYCRKMLDNGCTHMVMEVSSQGIMLHRTDGIAFEVGAFTNISPDHIGQNEHSSFEEYLECKTAMLSQCKAAIVNADDEHKDYILSHSKAGKTYTLAYKEAADFKLDNIRYVSDGSFVGVEFDLNTPNGSIDSRVGIPAIFNAYNGAFAIAACSLLGIKADILSHALEHIKVDGRMEIVYTSDKYTVIVDYAHNAIAMESLLNALREYNPKRLVVVFGCGGNRSKDRRYGMGEIGGKFADLSIITADNSRFENVNDIIADIESSIKKTDGEYIKIPDRKEAIYYAIENARQGDMIAVIGKGHEDYQEINGIRHHFLDREVVLEAVASRN